MRKKIDITKYIDRKYDICRICNVSPRTVDRWFKDGMPEQFLYMLEAGMKCKK